MGLKLKHIDKFYHSDSIVNGRLAKKFFQQLSEIIFQKSYQYWETHQGFGGSFEFPLTFSERNLYSIIGSSIDAITPVHTTEIFVQKSEIKQTENRMVDFWCLHQENESRTSINYFIEVKKGWYNLKEGTKENLDSKVKASIKSMERQLSNLKQNLKEYDWVHNHVFVGLIIINGYYHKNSSAYYDIEDVVQMVRDSIDNRRNAQVLATVWKPEEQSVFVKDLRDTTHDDENRKYRSESFAVIGVINSIKR